MNAFRLSTLLLAVASMTIAATDQPDPRSAKVIDSAGAESQISAIKITGVDARFGFDYQANSGRIAVATKDVEFAIPLRAISAIELSGSKTWTVNYRTKDGDTSVSGVLPEAATLTAESEFGAFSLPLGKLKRLEFSQPGFAAPPAKRTMRYRDGKADDRNFIATLTLTDGTTLHVAHLLRHAAYGVSGVDNMWIPPKPTYSARNDHYTDFRFIRGETAQTIPFERIKAVDFTSGEAVTVITRTDAKAEMKLSQKDEATLSGFTGTMAKGDFYVPAKLVKSITFGDVAK